MYNENDTFSTIRILPMSKKEFNFQSFEIVQNQFFQETLLTREYRFKSLGMKADAGTLVLFQYDGHIIAMGVLEDIIFYQKPLEGIYNGGYKFDQQSIVVFNPINKEEIKQIWYNFKQFSQAKQYLNPLLFSDFFKKVLKRKSLKYVSV